MTLGVTAVFWLPRTATVNSTSLVAGAGPAPLTIASGAWTALASSYADVATTVTRVMAGLAAAWEGDSATAAQTRLAAFVGWADEVAALATESAGKAGAQAAAYTTALAVMPSIPEIAVVKTAKTAAYSTGGAVNGTAEAAEAADRALDVRAALVMEAYEAATSVLSIPRSFTPPPQITTAIGEGVGAGVGPVQRFSDAEHDVTTRPEASETQDSNPRDPTRTVASAIESVTRNPDFASTATHAASSSAQSIASSVGNASTSAFTGAGITMPDHAVSPKSPNSMQPSPSTSSAGAAGFGGSGSAGALGPMSRGAFPASPVGTSQLDSFSPTTAYAPHDPAVAAPFRGAAPLTGARSEPDEVHEPTAYDDRIVQFDAGTAVVPSVIGSDPVADARRSLERSR